MMISFDRIPRIRRKKKSVISPGTFFVDLYHAVFYVVLIQFYYKTHRLVEVWIIIEFDTSLVTYRVSRIAQSYIYEKHIGRYLKRVIYTIFLLVCAPFFQRD